MICLNSMNFPKEPYDNPMKKKTIKNLRFIILTPLALLLCVVLYMFSNPFERIQRVRDDDDLIDMYFSFYETLMGEEWVNRLLYALLTTNGNYNSIYDVTHFIERRKKCEFLPYLESMSKFYGSMPKDTVLIVAVSRGGLLGGSHYDLTSPHAGFTIKCFAERLREKCEETYGTPDLFPKLEPRSGVESYKRYLQSTDSVKRCD